MIINIMKKIWINGFKSAQCRTDDDGDTDYSGLFKKKEILKQVESFENEVIVSVFRKIQTERIYIGKPMSGLWLSITELSDDQILNYLKRNGVI